MNGIGNYIIIGVGATIMIFGLSLSYYAMNYECPPEHACGGEEMGLYVSVPITIIGLGIVVVGIVLQWRQKKT